MAWLEPAAAEVMALPGVTELVATLRSAQILVTGGTGFMGRWLLAAVHALRERGAGLQLSVLSRDPSAFRMRYPEFAKQRWLTLLQGDVRSCSLPATPFDFVIHGATDTAAAAHEQPRLLYETIVTGTQRVLEHAVQCGARRVLLLSSGAVYGRQPLEVDRLPEEAPSWIDPTDVRDTYGEAKRTMELLGALFARDHGLETVVARGFAFVGAGLPLKGHFAIGNFIRDALHGGPIVVRGDGTPVRSYLYAADLAVWLFTLLVRGRAGRAYNVGADRAITVESLARLTRDILSPGAEVRVVGQATEDGPRHRYVPAIQRARELGLDVFTPLEEAIRRTGRWAGERP